MTAAKLTPEQARALNSIAMRGVWFPILIQIVFGLVLVLPVLFLFGLELGVLIVLIPAVILPAIAAAWIAVPKSLFKKRGKAQLLANSPTAFHAYRWRWVGISILAQVLLAITLGVLIDVVGIKLPENGMAGVSAFVSIYASNIFVAQRMLNKGDATLQIEH